MRKFILPLALVASVGLAETSAAQMIEFDGNDLRLGVVSQGKDCVAAGLSLTITATKGGRVTTYSTSASGFGSGIYIGAVQGQLNTTNNTTAPPHGVYRLTFSRPVNSIEFRIDAISNLFKPVETLSGFTTSNGKAQIGFQAQGNSALYDANKRVITANSGNGDGVITHSAPGKFDFFEFTHDQHPQNIGFTITNIKATPAQGICP